MILIADSGSSKTDWRLVNGAEIQQFASVGFNPNFISAEKIALELSNTFDSNIAAKVSEIYFYGAGCSSQTSNAVIEKGLRRVFLNTNVQIFHDLLGAARAACGLNKGIAGILGTGSNSCLFDGKEVIQEFRSGGYSIGDEGGGVDIGRRVLKAFIEERFPKELHERFERRYKLTIDEILAGLYSKPQPNKFMAGFSRFAFHNKENPFVSELIQEAFRSYFKNMICRYDQHQELPLNLVGSIAFYYQEILRKAAAEYQITIGNIIEKPISGLTLYHAPLIS